MKLKTRLLKLFDATLGLALCRVIGYWRHRSGAPEIAATPAPDSIERVLVIRPGGMGDMLMLLPVAECPGLRIAMRKEQGCWSDRR